MEGGACRHLRVVAKVGLRLGWLPADCDCEEAEVGWVHAELGVEGLGGGAREHTHAVEGERRREKVRAGEGK